MSSLNFVPGDFVEDDFEFTSPEQPVILFPFSIFNVGRRRRRAQQQPTLPKEKEKEKPKPRKQVVVKDIVFRYAIKPPAPPEPIPIPPPTPQELETERLFAQIREDIARKPVAIEVPALRHTVVKDVTFSYNINQLIEKDVTFPYQTQNIVTKDVTFVYDIKEVDWVRVASLQRAKTYLLALETIDRIDSSEDD